MSNNENNTLGTHIMVLFGWICLVFLAMEGCNSMMSKATGCDDTISQDVSIQPATSLRFFTAKWCGPCHKLKAILRDKEVQELLKLYEYKQVDVDKPENSELMEKYGIKSVPTLVFVKDGKITHKEVGLLTKQELLLLLRRLK